MHLIAKLLPLYHLNSRGRPSLISEYRELSRESSILIFPVVDRKPQSTLESIRDSLLPLLCARVNLPQFGSYPRRDLYPMFTIVPSQKSFFIFLNKFLNEIMPKTISN